MSPSMNVCPDDPVTLGLWSSAEECGQCSLQAPESYSPLVKARLQTGKRLTEDKFPTCTLQFHLGQGVYWEVISGNTSRGVGLSDREGKAAIKLHYKALPLWSTGI